MSKRRSRIEHSHSQISIISKDLLFNEIAGENEHDTIDVRIQALEERITACDTFYKISTQKLT